MKELLNRFEKLEKELDELRSDLIRFPAPAPTPVPAPKPSAEQWLLDYIQKPFEVKITDGYITYYRGDQWIFEQDLKNKYLWCYYHEVWNIFERVYSLEYEQIRQLHKDVVCKALNCEGLTPLIEKKVND